jgi:hypothetical protein
LKRRYAVYAVILAVSSLIMAESAFAQTTELSVPGSPGIGGFSVLVPSNVTLGSPFEVMVRAFYANGYVDRDFTGYVSFSASEGAISPSMSGAFTEGGWRGLINMSEAGSDIVVYVNDGNGHTGRSSPISVYQQNPTPTSSLTSLPNSTPTPSVPELPLIVTPIIFMAILFGVIALKRNQRNYDNKKAKFSIGYFLYNQTVFVSISLLTR